MSIEIDANTVHFAIADVNHKTDKVYRHLDYGSLEAGFYDDLAASDNRFFSRCMFKKAQNLFQKLRTRQEHFRVIKVSAIATETFREAHNAEELVQKIRRTTGIHIRILSPEEEDRMDFFSALTTTSDSENPVVWNIGIESFQLIIVDPTGGPFSHKGEFGSVNFMDYLKEVVQNKPTRPSASLSPISIEEINAGITFARYLARKTPLLIRRKLKKNKSRVTAIGSVFQDSVAIDIAENSKVVDSVVVEQFIREHEPDNFSRISDDKSSDTSLANAILVFGFMEELGIKKLYISDHKSTLGMLEYPVLWH
ncbi:hypothetical protein [Endozoicomonas sp.]|uniref:Ppx/GppA phosphatase family protein n=1 Tax=Endozoicomonas sp. TaxID=1892382 RepID=UPI00383B361C